MFCRFSILFLIGLFGAGNSFAQEIPMGGNYENGSTLNVIYRNDKSGKIYAATRGIGIIFRQGKHVTGKTRSYYEIDLQTLKHPKEKKVAGEADLRKKFVYGKINSVLLLRGALGLQNVLFSKADNKAVEVRYAYSLGPTIAFAKPYYIKVFTQGKRDPESMIFDSESFNSASSIQGRAGFSEGLPEIKFYPGATAKFNMSFEYAPYTNIIRAIETGITLDYFPRAVPMMARNPAENFMITLNVGFVFGRKWF